MNEDTVLDKNIKWLFKNSYSDILHLIILMKMSVNQGFLKLLISNTHHPFFNVYATSHNKQTNSVSEITGLVKKHIYIISFSMPSWKASMLIHLNKLYYMTKRNSAVNWIYLNKYGFL